MKNVIQELIRECHRQNVSINEDFLQFYVDLLCVDPRTDPTEDPIFKDNTIKQLQQQNNPQLTTLKLQWYFKNNFKSKNEVTQENRRGLLTKLWDLQKDILDTKNVTEPGLLAILLNKIVFYIALLSGLGNPEMDSVNQETKAALKSILSENELKELTTLPKVQKQEHILFCMKIVTGIRIFNKDCSKGGFDIVDLPGLLYKSLEVTRTKLRDLLVSLMSKINMLTTSIDKCYKINFKSDNSRYMDCKLPPQISPTEMDFIKSLLITYRQFEIFLRQLITVIEDDDNTTRLFNELKSILTRIHDVCSIRVAVPCSGIFPYFEKLAEVWTQLQDETIYLSHINKIFKKLINIFDQVKFPDEIVKAILDGSEVMTDAQRLKKYPSEELDFKNEEVYIIPKNNNMDSMYIECLRCDPWKLVQTNGGLLPGIPEMGVAVAINNYQYVFSEPQSAFAFFEDVSGVFQQLCELFTKKIEFIEMFNARKYMDSLMELKLSRQKSEEKTKSSGTQTEDYRVPDPNYVWNVWDLRRRVLKMADVQRMRTKSSQSQLNFNKREENAQTSNIKNKSIQTVKDKSTFICHSKLRH